ncbi:winged helix-turn-helix domain-containing protein [Maricaulis sp. CAU 1757]
MSHSPAYTSRNRRFHIGDALCDLDAATLVRDGRTHRLEPRLVGVMALLVQRAGSPVTRDEFLDTAWDADGSDEALNQAISRLRRLLGDPGAITTLPRLGYRLAEPPRPGTARPTGSAKTALQPVLRGLARRIDRSFVTGFATACALAAILALIAWPRTFEREIEFVSLGPDEPPSEFFADTP